MISNTKYKIFKNEKRYKVWYKLRHCGILTLLFLYVGAVRMGDMHEILGRKVEIEILSSAHRHKISDSDIIHSLRQSIYDETIQTDPNKTLSLGFDTKARLLEIIFHVITDNKIVVFHAMPCRKKYIERLQ